MQSEGGSGAVKKDPPLSATVRDPIDPRRDCDSASSHSVSQHASPSGEELNHATGTSPSSTAPLRSPYVALPSHYGTQVTHTQHISGEPNTNMHSPSNTSASRPLLPKIFSPQLRTSASGPLSPIPTAKGKGVNTMYTPLRLDSQLLGSPWPGQYQWPANPSVPSPTRAGSNPGSAVYSSYWNATSSPVPYPCGSPTAYNTAMRIMSPSAQSLRQQQLHNNDGSSPVQLSISTIGHENSFVGTASGFASPSGTGVLHSAILDAPLQVSLVPPPYREDCPFFSFGNSIMQSTPFTPTIQTPTSRGHSIYHDTMLELSQHRQELDNPLTLVQADNTRGASHDCAPTSLASAPVLSASTTPIIPIMGDHLHQASSRGTSEASVSSSAGVPVPPKMVDGTLVDFAKLGQLSPPSPRLLEPLTARPNAHSDGDDDDSGDQNNNHNTSAGEKRLPPELADDYGRSSRNSTPDATAISPNTAADGETSQQLGELNRTKRPHETDSNASGPREDGREQSEDEAEEEEGEASDTELHNIAAVSLSDANFAYNAANVKSDGATPLGQGSRAVAPTLQIATPQTVHTRRHSGLPTTPGVAPPATTAATTDFRLFMPSPVDESGHAFGPLPDSAARPTPSEHSTSQLSLVPNFGVWQASPTLFSAWQSASMSPSQAPSVRAALDDLLEVLRLLQSDIVNVYNCVSVHEHTVRHWIGCTLSALLHLTVEVSHGVDLSAQEASEGDTGSEQAATYAQLGEEIRAGAASCVGVLRSTIQSIQRDRDVLEPLLLTSMLARGAITALLHRLEKAYVRNDSQPVLSSAAASMTSSGPATGVPTNRRTAPTVPVPTPLTAERMDELMGSDVLCEELSGEWRQFASDYNRKVLRYLFLRVLYVQLNGKDALSCSSSGCDGTTSNAEATSQRSSPVSGTHNSTATTLRTIESAWAEDQLKRCSVVFQQGASKSDHRGVQKSESMSQVDDTGAQLFREALCQDFPAYELVKEVFSSFREGECWRCWYILLGQMMECTFNARDKAELFNYVLKQFVQAPSPSASAAAHAISTGQITLEQVEEALDKVEASLATMEEQGKARRVAILQLLLRRIFVLGVVSSVHRALGKDAVVSDAQLATYVQVQRKSLEEVEAQLSSEHAEGKSHIKCIRAFLVRFADGAVEAHATTAAKDGAARVHLSRGVATPPVPSPDPQWNTSTVGPLASLLTSVRSRSGTTEQSDDAGEGSRGEEEEVQRRARDALTLIRDVSTRVVDTTKSLCILLQSDVDLAEAKRDYNVSPTKMPIPSTRALRRLQASLAEAQRAVLLCLTSLHLD